MAYSVPLQDVRFALHQLADLAGVCKLPGNEDLSPDLVDAVLEENARFLNEVVAPLNRVADLNPPVWDDGKVTTPVGYQQAFRQFVEGGWQGLAQPSSIGGQGMPKVVAAACTEALNGASLAFALCPLLTDGVVEALLTAGSPEQQVHYLPRLIAGEYTGTMNLTEPQAGSDLAAIRTRAEPQADGSYRLFGQKIFITFGEHDLSDNIIHLVLARTPDAPPGIKGISLFIVPKHLVNEDGTRGARNDVYCASLEHKLGIHGSPTAVLLYGEDKGEVGPGAIGYLVGEEHHGLQYMFVMMNAARYAVGLQGVAVAERATQQALAYAQERVQGRALGSSQQADTIDQHPDVQRMLLTMRACTEGSRALAYVAAAEADHALGLESAQQRRLAQARYEYLVPVVKGFATEVAQEVTSLAVQVHGGMGYIEETGVAQHLRDARILTIYEGTTAIQANDLLGRKTLRDGGEVALSFMPAMRATATALREQIADGESLAQRLEAAISDLETVVRFLIEQAADQSRRAYAGSVPYLMLTGWVHAGWHWARALLVCQGQDDTFHRNKVIVARFYLLHLLPHTMALRTAITEGGDAVVALLQP